MEEGLCEQISSSFAEKAKLFVRAVYMHLKRTGIVQGKHSNKTLAVDFFLLIAYQHFKRLNHCQRDKVLYLPERPDPNIKLIHAGTSYCTNCAFCVIMTVVIITAPIPKETHTPYYTVWFLVLQLGVYTIYTN